MQRHSMNGWDASEIAKHIRSPSRAVRYIATYKGSPPNTAGVSQ